MRSLGFSYSDEAAQYGGDPKSVSFVIHHGGCFTPTPSRSYIGGQVSSFDVVDIDEFCLHDLKEMVVKLGYGIADLMYDHFLRPRLGLDYGLHPLIVDADVLELAKYVKDNNIILVYVEHGSTNVDSSIFVTPKNRVAIAVDNHLRKARIEIDSNLDVNRNLTPICHRNLTKEWEKVSSKALSIGEVMKKLSNKQLACSDKGPIVVDIDDLDEIVGDYANTEKEIIVHVGISSIVENVVDCDMLYDTERDLDHDPKHDEVFDDDKHILEDVPVNDGIDSERRTQLRELRRIGKAKNQGPNKLRVRCEGTIPALIPFVSSDTAMCKNVFSQTKGSPVIRENNISVKQNVLGKDKTIKEKGKKVNEHKKKDKYSCPWTMFVAYTNEGKWEVRTLIEDHKCLTSREIKACTSRFLLDHVIKTLATNLDIPMRVVQDQMQKQFD
ncbi:hypothetical protein Tco_1489955, partial [Tanacetum coccineum]